eukprot:363958-Chlamydomonas_euryale.AAC.3
MNGPGTSQALPRNGPGTSQVLPRNDPRTSQAPPRNQPGASQAPPRNNPGTARHHPGITPEPARHHPGVTLKPARHQPGITQEQPRNRNFQGPMLPQEHPDAWIVNAYVPNSGEGLKRLNDRTSLWDPAMSKFVKVRPRLSRGVWRLNGCGFDIGWRPQQHAKLLEPANRSPPPTSAPVTVSRMTSPEV